MNAVDFLALLMIYLNLSFSFIFQVIDENLAIDCPDCYSVPVMTESNRRECRDYIISLCEYGFDIFLSGNIKKLDLPIVATTRKEKIVHR
jgi:hypothetical protein